MQIGVLALVVGACFAVAPRCRMMAIESGAALAFMTFMFGPAGAGGFVVMQALTWAPMLAAQRGVRPVTALILVTVVSGIAAACAAEFLAKGLPARWEAFAPMAPAFALAAPALVLRTMTVATLGAARAEAWRLNALGPLLVGLVVGAGVDGLHGAAVGWAAGQLAAPLVMLALARRGAPLSAVAMGVLAAGFAATLATGAALQFAEGSALAAGPAVVVGLIVWTLALRVHAPAAARRLGRAVLAPLAVRGAETAPTATQRA